MAVKYFPYRTIHGIIFILSNSYSFSSDIKYLIILKIKTIYFLQQIIFHSWFICLPIKSLKLFLSWCNVYKSKLKYYQMLVVMYLYTLVKWFMTQIIDCSKHAGGGVAHFLSLSENLKPFSQQKPCNDKKFEEK